MGAERKFQAQGINCFMKSTPGHFLNILSFWTDSKQLKVNNCNSFPQKLKNWPIVRTLYGMFRAWTTLEEDYKAFLL
jgi:hypothetical protein